MSAFKRRLIAKEIASGYIYIGMVKYRYFPEPRVEFTILVNGDKYKAHTFDWHCVCRCPNPVHTHRCIDITAFKHLLSEKQRTVVIKKTEDRIYELEVVD